MSAIVNVHEAKTQFSKLLDRAHAGEEIIVAKAGKPYARLVKIEEPIPFQRKPGGWPGLSPLVDDAMDSPLSEADLVAWESKFEAL